MFRGNRQQMPDICGDTVGETQLEMHPLDLHFYLGISQSESATLLALLKRSPILFGSFQRVADTL